MKTCLSAKCPERFSSCCGAISTTNPYNKGAPFVCSGCGKEFNSPECTAGKESVETLKGKICNCSCTSWRVPQGIMSARCDECNGIPISVLEFYNAKQTLINTLNNL